MVKSGAGVEELICISRTQTVGFASELLRDLIDDLYRKYVGVGRPVDLFPGKGTASEKMLAGVQV